MGKTAIVTGATRGIGRATALGLARRGYDVAITGRTVDEGDIARRPEASELPELTKVPGSLRSTAAAIEACGGRAVPLVMDLLETERLAPTAQAAIDALGHVDVLLNNAIYVGPAGQHRFLDTPAQEIERRLYANVTAQLLFTQPVLRAMVAAGGGTIANMTSGGGFLDPTHPVGEGGWALTYGVSKAGLHRFAGQLLAEHRADGIRAFNIQPGYVATERVLAAGDKLAFVADSAAPVALVGEAIAAILDDPGAYENGSMIHVQDVAVGLGILPPRDG